jgi:hypothetical protein
MFWAATASSSGAARAWRREEGTGACNAVNLAIGSHLVQASLDTGFTGRQHGRPDGMVCM